MCPVCRFDITEVQLCLAGLQMFTATVGPSLWNVMVNFLAAVLHGLLPSASTTGAFLHGDI